MIEEWFIARGEKEYGPYTAAQLKELGTTGQVRPTDAVWREGMPNRIAATKVKGLIPVTEVVAPPTASEENPVMAATGEQTEQGADPGSPLPKTTEEEAADRKKEQQKRIQAESRKKRVVGAKGARILSQDGKEVRFRKKCVKCGTEDRSSSKMPIRAGTTRTSFFCPNCRKLHSVEIQGI